MDTLIQAQAITEKNISLAINFIDLADIESNFESVKKFPNEEFKSKLETLWNSLNEEHNVDKRTEIFDEIFETVRSQLKSLETVGQILDFLGFTIKMLFVPKSLLTSDVILLKEIFQIMPASWESDPVKVHLITKIIYETLNADFNNTMHVLTKIICVNNKLGLYVALTLFWALFLDHFKNPKVKSHNYYKMYNADKFFKLLLNNEPLNNNQDANSIFRLLLLISIYQNYVLMNKDPAENHQIFHEFFKVSQSDREKMKSWLINLKTLIETNNPLGKTNQSSDVLMLLEFLELDLIKSISED